MTLHLKAPLKGGLPASGGLFARCKPKAPLKGGLAREARLGGSGQRTDFSPFLNPSGPSGHLPYTGEV